MTATPSLTDWQCQIGALLVGAGTPYGLRLLTGTDELPDIRTTDVTRPVGHGEFQGDDFSAGRTFELGLDITAAFGVAYTDALSALRAVMVPTKRALVPFWFKIPGRPQLSAAVKVRRYRAPTDVAYSLGIASVEAQLHAIDPLLYGDVVQVATGFPTAAGGLQYPLYTNRTIRLGMLSFGARSSTGRLVVTNPGSADMWPMWQVTGPVDALGFEIIRTGTGDRLRFEAGVSAGSTLVMDSSTGVVLVDGYADRSGALTWRDWAPIAPGMSAEFTFTNLGSFSAAQLTATTTPGWW